MTIGDAVIVRKGRYSFSAHVNEGKRPWVWTDTLGVITDIRRPRGAYPSEVEREYRVYTTDGKHDWCHEDDLFKPQ